MAEYRMICSPAYARALLARLRVVHPAPRGWGWESWLIPYSPIRVVRLEPLGRYA
jgi:hypothetical protein